MFVIISKGDFGKVSIFAEEMNEVNVQSGTIVVSHLLSLFNIYSLRFLGSFVEFFISNEGKKIRKGVIEGEFYSSRNLVK